MSFRKELPASGGGFEHFTTDYGRLTVPHKDSLPADSHESRPQPRAQKQLLMTVRLQTANDSPVQKTVCPK